MCHTEIDISRNHNNHTNKTMKITLSIVSLAFLLASPVAFGDAAEIYGKNCASCHGADGKGQTAMGKKFKLKDYTDAKVQASFSDKEATTVILEGKGAMKTKGKVADADVAGLVKYIRAFKK